MAKVCTPEESVTIATDQTNMDAYLNLHSDTENIHMGMNWKDAEACIF